VLKYISLCFASINGAMEDEQRGFWRSQLATAQAPLESETINPKT
jgi:hypothetical protein